MVVVVVAAAAAARGERSYEATGKGVRRRRLLLPASDVAAGQAVSVRWNGRTVKRRVMPDVALLISDRVERLDPGFLPVAAIKL